MFISRVGACEVSCCVLDDGDWSVENFPRIRRIRFGYDEANRMQPLKPGHHSAGIVANEAGRDAVCFQRRLRDVSLGFTGESPDHKVGFRWHSTCLLG